MIPVRTQIIAGLGMMVAFAVVLNMMGVPRDVIVLIFSALGFYTLYRVIKIERRYRKLSNRDR